DTHDDAPCFDRGISRHAPIRLQVLTYFPDCSIGSPIVIGPGATPRYPARWGRCECGGTTHQGASRMKKTIIATTMATLLAATALPVLAQDVDAGAGVTVETPDVDAAVDTAVDAAAGVADSLTSVTAAIAGSATVDLSAVTDESQVNVVLLSSLEGDVATEGAALDEALSANAEGSSTLQANIDGNAAIKAKLDAEGYAASDVVAVK